MVSSIPSLLKECKTKILQICASTNEVVRTAMHECGLEVTMISNMTTAASRMSTDAVNDAFEEARKQAKRKQRELSRSLKPLIQDGMQHAYRDAMSVERGKGTFNRMKATLRRSAQPSVNSV